MMKIMKDMHLIKSPDVDAIYINTINYVIIIKLIIFFILFISVT